MNKVENIGLTMDGLEKHAKECLEKGFDLVVFVEMPGFSGIEEIRNPAENIKGKVEYYKNVYDKNCEHKHAKGIRLIAVGI